MTIRLALCVSLAFAIASSAPAISAEAPPKAPEPGAPPVVNFSGVVPALAVSADEVPGSECGVGALMPWADRLWLVTYVAHIKGSGTGLYEIDANLSMRKRPESVVGTYANRMIHAPSKQCIIGPHFIDSAGNVRTCKAVQGHRLTATMRHLTDPAGKVYFLTMEGLLFEVDVKSLEARQLADLVKELGIAGKPHFKGGYTGCGRVVVANNTYDESDVLGKPTGGRLAEWDGKKWTILAETAFNEVMGRPNVIFATGWDGASAILKVFAQGAWSTYRLPKATQAFDHAWFTEWPRIREVETERWLMDCHGMFYELSSLVYGGKPWALRPISTHLRMVPDFCSWRGMMVMGGDETTPIGENNPYAGQPQSGLWFGKTDDLWRFGKPRGWGGPWRAKPVKAGETSDPYLMTGFDQKSLHLANDSDEEVQFAVEVDFVGSGAWREYARLIVPARGYVHHEFPAGYSAHWVRLTARKACTATAWFIYN